MSFLFRRRRILRSSSVFCVDTILISVRCKRNSRHEDTEKKEHNSLEDTHTEGEEKNRNPKWNKETRVRVEIPSLNSSMERQQNRSPE